MEPTERRAMILGVEAIAAAMHALGSVRRDQLRRWLGDAMDDDTFRKLVGELKIAGYIKEDADGLLVWKKKEVK